MAEVNVVASAMLLLPTNTGVDEEGVATGVGVGAGVKEEEGPACT